MVWFGVIRPVCHVLYAYANLQFCIILQSRNATTDNLKVFHPAVRASIRLKPVMLIFPHSPFPFRFQIIISLLELIRRSQHWNSPLPSKRCRRSGVGHFYGGQRIWAERERCGKRSGAGGKRHERERAKSTAQIRSYQRCVDLAISAVWILLFY